MIHRIDVRITTPLNPTEVRDRVETAITNLCPAAAVEERNGELYAETHAMDRFAEKLRDREIVDAARDVFLASVEGDTFAFDLKKQPAFEGVVNFAVGNPDELGDLHVRVRVDEPDVEGFVDYLAPATARDDD